MPKNLHPKSVNPARKHRIVILVDKKLKSRLAKVEKISGMRLSKIARVTLSALCNHVESSKGLTFPIYVNP